MVNDRALVMALGLFVVSLAWIPGCRSGPAQALDGARYYLSGSEALERGDPERALVELLRAAELVPRRHDLDKELRFVGHGAPGPLRPRCTCSARWVSALER